MMWAFLKNKMTTPTLSIIIPAYNEAKRIPKTLRNISSFLRGEKISFEIIVVPNNCKDDTEEVVSKIMQEEIPEIRIAPVKYPGKQGNTKGLAISTGMQESAGVYALFIDADNATDFHEVIKFMQCIHEGADVCIASRYVQGSVVVRKQPYLRVILSRASNLLIRAVLLPGIYDTQCGFKMFSKRAVQTIFRKTTVLGWGIDLEILAIARYFSFSVKELPVVWEAQDDSTVRSHAFFYTLKELFKIRKNIRDKYYD